MVGGGRGAFIGAVHRIAANMDGQIELVCGAFSSSPRKSKASGRDLAAGPAGGDGEAEARGAGPRAEGREACLDDRRLLGREDFKELKFNVLDAMKKPEKKQPPGSIKEYY